MCRGVVLLILGTGDCCSTRYLILDTGMNVVVVSNLLYLFVIVSCAAVRCCWIGDLGSLATSCGWSGLVVTGSWHWWSSQNLVRDAGDECGVGAKLVTLFVIAPCSVIMECGAVMVALVVIVPCSTVLVAPICRRLCVQFPCGEALGTVGGFEGSDTGVVGCGVVGPVGCSGWGWNGRLGSKVFSPVGGHRGSLSVEQKGQL